MPAKCRLFYSDLNVLTNCGLLAPYDDIDLRQHWFRLLPILLKLLTYLPGANERTCACRNIRIFQIILAVSRKCKFSVTHTHDVIKSYEIAITLSVSSFSVKTNIVIICDSRHIFLTLSSFPFQFGLKNVRGRKPKPLSGILKSVFCTC